MALYPVEDRFPLTTGGGIDGASSGPIPFGLRFFLPMPPATSPAVELSRWRYDRDRQVAVDAARPLRRAMTEQGTTVTILIDRPGWERFGLSVTSNTHVLWLDRPEHVLLDRDGQP